MPISNKPAPLPFSGTLRAVAGRTVHAAASASRICRDRSPCWASPVRMAAKRLLDIAVSAMLLTGLFPILLGIAGLIKLTSRGPVFYRWRVVGRGGAPLTSYKFRSMVANADALKPQLLGQNEMLGPVFKLTRDPRITRLGAWLRCHSLDELPQLYSVLVGHMSLVGPRPQLQTEFARFNNFQKQKLQVKPGLTCLWQVSGRNRIRDLDEWVTLDLEYIRTFSVGLDFRILLRTVAEIIRGSGK